MTRSAAHALLFLSAMFWGFGNVVQKSVLDHAGPLNAVGLRCLLAALVLAPLLLAERGRARQPGFGASAAGVGLLFAIGMGLQQAAYQWTTVTNAGFLVNACTVLTPLAAWILLRRRPSRIIWTAAAATFTGAVLLSGGSTLAIPNPGDALCLASAATYAVWYVALERHAARYGLPFTTTIVQFGCTALLFLPAGLAVEGIPAALASDGLVDILALAVVSTAAPYVLLTVAQRYTSAAAAAVIVSGEGLFGAIGAHVVFGERLAPAGMAGSVLIVAAIMGVALEADLRRLAATMRTMGTAGPARARATGR